jgi:hypothetical protein
MIECQPLESDDVMTRLRWWAFKFCGKGERENFASDTMSDAIARIKELEAALSHYACGCKENKCTPEKQRYRDIKCGWPARQALLGKKNY